MKNLREQLWESIERYPAQDAKEILNIGYDFVGSKKLAEIVDVDEFFVAAPESKHIATNIVTRFITAYHHAIKKV